MHTTQNSQRGKNSVVLFFLPCVLYLLGLFAKKSRQQAGRGYVKSGDIPPESGILSSRIAEEHKEAYVHLYHLPS